MDKNGFFIDLSPNSERTKLQRITVKLLTKKLMETRIVQNWNVSDLIPY